MTPREKKLVKAIIYRIKKSIMSAGPKLVEAKKECDNGLKEIDNLETP